jgi:hypothetical protein
VTPLAGVAVPAFLVVRVVDLTVLAGSAPAVVLVVLPAGIELFVDASVVDVNSEVELVEVLAAVVFFLDPPPHAAATSATVSVVATTIIRRWVGATSPPLATAVRLDTKALQRDATTLNHRPEA